VHQTCGTIPFYEFVVLYMHAEIRSIHACVDLWYLKWKHVLPQVLRETQAQLEAKTTALDQANGDLNDQVCMKASIHNVYMCTMLIFNVGDVKFLMIFVCRLLRLLNRMLGHLSYIHIHICMPFDAFAM
jgi:hypothetical protein